MADRPVTMSDFQSPDTTVSATSTRAAMAGPDAAPDVDRVEIKRADDGNGYVVSSFNKMTPVDSMPAQDMAAVMDAVGQQFGDAMTPPGADDQGSPSEATPPPPQPAMASTDKAAIPMAGENPE